MPPAPLGWLQLLQRPLRLLVAVAGIAFAVFKILLEDATLLSDALHRRTTSILVRLSVEDIDRGKLDSLRSMLERFQDHVPSRSS